MKKHLVPLVISVFALASCTQPTGGDGANNTSNKEQIRPTDTSYTQSADGDGIKNSPSQTAPKGFVYLPRATIQGKEYIDPTGTPYEQENNGVFIPGRTVTLDAFYISQYEVTQDEYKEVMQGQTVSYYVDNRTSTLDAEPSLCKAGSTTYALENPGIQGKRPVENITYYDAIYYCNARSEKEGLTKAYNIVKIKWVYQNHITEATVELVKGANGYRLPTEAEWEYAARGGDPTLPDWDYLFSGAPGASDCRVSSNQNPGVDAVGWTAFNNITGVTIKSFGTDGDVTDTPQGKGTHQVGLKKPNRLGLYDMSGNVSEWCYDQYVETITAGNVTNPIGCSTDSTPKYSARGGSWDHYSNRTAVLFREGGKNNKVCAEEGHHKDWLGFRVVRSKID